MPCFEASATTTSQPAARGRRMVRRCLWLLCRPWQGGHACPASSLGLLRCDQAARLGASLAPAPPAPSPAPRLPSPDIQVRLLLSIDRRQSAEEALDTARLAVRLRDEGVVGLDLSGNPAVGQVSTAGSAGSAGMLGRDLSRRAGRRRRRRQCTSCPLPAAARSPAAGGPSCLALPQWDTWLPALEHARQAGLKVTVHAAEVHNPGGWTLPLPWLPVPMLPPRPHPNPPLALPCHEQRRRPASWPGGPTG